MQVAGTKHHYSTSINHIPSNLEKELPEIPSIGQVRRKPIAFTPLSSRRGQLGIHQEKQGTQAEASAMAVDIISPIGAAQSPALRSHKPDCQYSLQPRVAPKKDSSLPVPLLSPSLIYRRHSWTTNNRDLQPDQERSSFNIMRSGANDHGDPFLDEQGGPPTSKDLSIDLLTDEAILFTTRASATWDMAHFLRNTGPQSPPKESTLKELTNKLPCKKKNRGLFRKWKESSCFPDEEEQTLAGGRDLLANGPPEGVKQKTTTCGNKYLQIVPNQTLDLRHQSSQQNSTQSRAFPSLPTPPAEPFGSDAQDPWMSALDSHRTSEDLSRQESHTKYSVDLDRSNTKRSNRPRTPLSYISEAVSQLPPIETGFGLSFIDGSHLEPYTTGSESEGEDVLNSNHMSTSSSPSPSNHETAEFAETHEMPFLAKRNDSATGDDTYTIPDFPQPTPRYQEKAKVNSRSSDVLAGQGLRRPEVDSERRVSSNTNASSLLPAANLQASQTREASVRAKKIKALQDARRNIDELVKERVHQKQASPIASKQGDCSNDALPPSPVARDPKSSQFAQTRQMFEKAPAARARSCKKPTPLVLHERSSSNCIEEEADLSPRRELPQTPTQTLLGSPTLDTPSPPPPTLPLKYRYRATPSLTSTSANSINTPQSHNAKQSSVSSLVTTISRNPQAVAATSQFVGPSRVSVCSSHVSPSKETRLEARVDALERENKLLEAALMAVLKTSGTLNRCPCNVLKDYSESVAKDAATTTTTTSTTAHPLPASAGLPHSRATTPVAKVPSSELKRVAEDEDENDASSLSRASSSARRGSTDSNGSSISALEVYLRTKIGVRNSHGGGSTNGSSRSSSESMK